MPDTAVPRRRAPSPSTSVAAARVEWLTMALLGAMTIGAPLIAGAKPPIVLFVLELAALVVLLLVAASARPLALPTPAKLALVLLIATPLVQLVPLPPGLWAALPGHRDVADALAAIGADDTIWRPISLTPAATELAALALLLPLAALLGALSLRRDALLRVVQALLIVAVLEALIALAQFPADPNGALRRVLSWAENSGTYTNRNHLAGLLEMTLPVLLGLLAASVRMHREDHAHRAALLRTAPLLYAAMAVAVLLGLVFSRSRTGAVLAPLALLVAAAVFARPLVRELHAGTVSTVTVLGAVGALAIGLAPILQRFALQEAVDDARWVYAETTWVAARAMLPFGAGLGSFATIYPAFQRGDAIGGVRVNEAHNDYLEALLEGGLPWAIAIALALWVYARRWPALWRQLEDDPPLRYVQLGAGIGIGLLMLHSLVDYNLQTPANAFVFALLFGVFLHPGAQARGPDAARSARRGTG